MKQACIFLLLLALAPFSFAQRVEKLPAVSSEALRRTTAALDSTGYRIVLPNTLAACDVWLAAKVTASKHSDAKGAVYPDFADSEFLGVLTFPRGGGHDFRGQTV